MVEILTPNLTNHPNKLPQPPADATANPFANARKPLQTLPQAL